LRSQLLLNGNRLLSVGGPSMRGVCLHKTK
jgi:hypothetical protein